MMPNYHNFHGMYDVDDEDADEVEAEQEARKAAFAERYNNVTAPKKRTLIETWKPWLGPGDHHLVSFTCPQCKRWMALFRGTHWIVPDGTIRPSVVCAFDDCEYHEFCRLANWPGLVLPNNLLTLPQVLDCMSDNQPLSQRDKWWAAMLLLLCDEGSAEQRKKFLARFLQDDTSEVSTKVRELMRYKASWADTKPTWDDVKDYT